MRAPSFSCAAGFSLFFHVFLLIISLVAARYSHIYKTPAPYIVSLEEAPAVSVSGGSEAQPEAPQVEAPRAEPVKEPVKEPPMRIPEKPRPETVKKENENRVRDRIAAMQAQMRLEKRAALRRKVVDIGAAKSTAGKGGHTGTGSGAGPSGASYESLVGGKIHQQWIYPETLDRDLETVIAIRILKDGSVTILGVEKSSGNRLFDRSVMSAIAKASPLPPPQQEMEMGVRFRP
jgi:colicin import membrane protein